MKRDFFTKNMHKVWTLLFGLSAIEGIAAIVALLTLPSDSDIIFGLSPARIAILTGVLAVMVLSVFLVLNPARDHVISFISGKRVCFVILMSLAIAGICLTALSILNDLYIGTHVYSYHAYAQRLAPLFIYISAFLIQTALLLVIQNWNKWHPLFQKERSFLLNWVLVYGGLLVLVLLITITKFGLTTDDKGWGAPTVPLMEWQIWLGILLCLGARLLAESQLFSRLAAWRRDNPISSSFFVSLLIWLFALMIWANQPVPPGFFATPPRAPNYEIYPFSDAAFYDHHAQSLLIGLGFRGESIPPRPLYIVFLAMFHVIAGQDYTSVVLVQTMLLAFFPVTAFWIGRKLASDTVGWITAIFIILREWTSILSTPFTSDVSTSKLLFADLPAALMVSLVMIAFIIWMQNPQRPVYGLLTGGLLGISLLVRTQIIILLPVILIIFWIELLRRQAPFRSYFFPTILCLIGLMLAVAPWLSRNYGITGQFVFDHPESQTRIMVQRYYPEVEPEDFDRRPGETTVAYNSRLSGALKERIMTDPVYVIQFVAAHWLNSEIANLHIFPVRFSLLDVKELAVPSHPFWEEWNGTANPKETAVMLLNLAVLTAGVVYLVRKNSWVGIFPFLVNLAYHFSNAAARNSGWRYLLPVDWVFLSYFSAGIFAIINIGSNHVSFEKNKRSKKQTIPLVMPYFSLTAVALGILCMGFTPLAAERSFPRIYETASAVKLHDTITDNAEVLSTRERESLEKALESPDTKILHGRMLYPRYYGADEGEEKTAKTGYAPMPYARYVFLVAGDPEGTIVFPHTRDDIPLRNAQDVILVGCMDGLAVKAGLVILPEQDNMSYSADPGISWECPTQP